MAHLALYRKWRPTTFSQVCGQEAVTSVLSYQIKTGKTSHAYLFCGSRGTGKTSCAKIMAKALNCLSPKNGDPCGECEACRAIENETATDVVEMDAASNNGVEYIRDIREEVVYAPAMLKNRVYIIDEVHMLSASAFNALLKTLEEPPEQVVFILATTELQKIPATILSRCQRFDFRRLNAADIAAHLEMIAAAEGIAADRDALFRIARLAQGGMRDAISMLELCAAGGERIDAELVQRTAGVSSFDLLYRTVCAVCEKDYETLFQTVDQLFRTSRDPLVFLQDLIGFYRDMLVIRTTKEPEKYLEVSDSEYEKLRSIAARVSRETMLAQGRMLDDAFAQLSRTTADKRLMLETVLLRLCDDRVSTDPDVLLARIAALEERLAEGVSVGQTGTRAGAGSASDRTQEAPKENGASACDDVKEREGQAHALGGTGSGNADGDRSAVRAAATPDTASEKKTPMLHKIPDFIEAVKAMETTDMSAASILKLAVAAVSEQEHTVVLQVENEFYRLMLERDSVREQLLTHLRRLESLRGIAIDKITVTVGKKQSAEEEKPDLSEFDDR